jgi:mitochondrial fission protein ELM1
MTRRARADGGLSWDDKRQQWIAAVTVGYDGRGKRVFRRASGRTKTKAKARLREILDPHPAASTEYPTPWSGAKP